MEATVKRIIADILGIDETTINNESSPDNVEEWDSLKHMNIIIAIEEEFNLTFSDEEIGDMLNVQLIIYTLNEKKQ